MNKHLVISLTALVLFTGNTWADGVVIPKRQEGFTAVNCSGDYINNQESGTVRYKAVWEKNTYTITYNCGTGATGTPYISSQSISFETNWTGIPNENDISGSGDATTVNGCSKNGWHPVSWSCVYGDPSSTSLNIPTSGNTTPYNVDYDATCTLQWEHNCVAKLHVKNEFLCLYTEKVSAEGNPSLVIQKSSTSPKYYAAMSPVEDNKTINSGSAAKLYIKYGNKTYNVHDKSVSE